MTISSFILSGGLERLKMRFHVSGGLLGMLAALGGATPEISSAVTALFVKQHDVGVGIIIGSNIFNLAALLGLCALVAGRLPLRRQAMLFNGAISFIVTVVLILLVFRFISAPVSVVLLVLLLVPYAIVSGLKPNQLKQWRLPENIRTFLTHAIASTPPCFRGPQNSHAEIMVLGMDGRGCAHCHNCHMHGNGSFRGFFKRRMGTEQNHPGRACSCPFDRYPRCHNSY